MSFPFYGCGQPPCGSFFDQCNPCFNPCGPPPCRPHFNQCGPLPIPCSDAFGQLLQTTTETVAANSPVQFNTQGPALNVAYTSSSILVNVPGNYLASFNVASPSVSPTGSPVFGISVNNQTPSYLFSAPNGTTVTGDQILSNLYSGNSVALQAVGYSGDTFVLGTTGYGSYTGIAAELTLTKI